jgi:hypothetical protein
MESISESESPADFQRYLYTKMPGWSCLALVSLRSLSRRGCSFVVCGRGASMREASMRETVEAGTFDQGIFFRPLPLTHTTIYIMNNSKHALTINQPDNQLLKC